MPASCPIHSIAIVSLPLPCFRRILQRTDCPDCLSSSRFIEPRVDQSDPGKKKAYLSLQHQGHIFNSIPNHMYLSKDVKSRKFQNGTVKVANGPKHWVLNRVDSLKVLGYCLRQELTAEGNERQVVEPVQNRKQRSDKGVLKHLRKHHQPQSVQFCDEVPVEDIGGETHEDRIVHRAQSWQVFRGGMLEHGTIKIVGKQPCLTCQLVMNNFHMDSGKI